MGRYNRFDRTPMKERPWKIHPVWRGIGCVLIVLLPIMAYAGADVLIKSNLKNGWMAIPVELAGTIFIPFIGGIPYLYAKLLAGVVLLVIGYAILTIIYSLLFSAVGPPRYGPMDAPPPRKPKRRR